MDGEVLTALNRSACAKQPRKTAGQPPAGREKNHQRTIKKIGNETERGKERKRARGSVKGSVNGIATKKENEKERRIETERRTGITVKVTETERITIGAVVVHVTIVMMNMKTAGQETMEESGIEMSGTRIVIGHPDTERMTGGGRVVAKAREPITTTHRPREKGKRVCL